MGVFSGIISIDISGNISGTTPGIVSCVISGALSIGTFPLILRIVLNSSHCAALHCEGSLNSLNYEDIPVVCRGIFFEKSFRISVNFQFQTLESGIVSMK